MQVEAGTHRPIGGHAVRVRVMMIAGDIRREFELIANRNALEELWDVETDCKETKVISVAHAICVPCM